MSAESLPLGIGRSITNVIVLAMCRADALLLVLAFGAYIDIVQASTFVAIGALGPFLASDAPISFGGGIGCGGRSMHEVHSQQAVDPRLILGMYRAV